jgi:hypothetical protein
MVVISEEKRKRGEVSPYAPNPTGSPLPPLRGGSPRNAPPRKKRPSLTEGKAETACGGPQRPHWGGLDPPDPPLA